MPGTESHPFPYFGHGCAYSRKSLEVVLWFRRPIPVARRKAIERLLPGPISSVYAWGKQWLQTGSHGDTYEFEVAQALHPASPELALSEPTREEWDDFERQLEAFARRLHAREPLAFFFKPANLGDWWSAFSPWHAWSVRNFREQVEPWLAKEKAAGAREVVTWVRTAFLRSLEALEPDAATTPTSLGEVEALFAGDGLSGDVAELSPEISRLRTNASLLASQLDGLRPTERAKALAGLLPYTQLAFYAAWPKHVGGLTAQRGWLKLLARLARRTSEVRPSALVSSLLWRIARALSGHEDAEAGPVTALPLAGSREAAPVWRLCLSYRDAPVRAWLEAANTFERLGDWAGLLEVSQRAEAKLRGLPPERRQIDHLTPGDPLVSVYTNQLYAAQKLGRAALARQIARRSAGLTASNPQLMLNQLYTLIEASDFAAAWQLAHQYRDAGGKLTPEVLINLTAIYPRSQDAKSELGFLREAVKRCRGPKGNAYIRHATLLENLGWPLNERREFDTLLDLLDRHERERGLKPTALLLDRRLYALMSRPKSESAALGLARRIVRDYAKRPAFWQGNPQTLANAAGVLARHRRLDEAFQALRAARKLGYDLAGARTDDDLKPLLADPRFARLAG